MRLENYSNGLVSFMLRANSNMKGKDINQSLTFLASFRHYTNFHLQHVKTMLHSRMRTRVEKFERVIYEAKRDKEGPKNWKETYGGISQSERDLQEEQKIEEVLQVGKK